MKSYHPNKASFLEKLIIYGVIGTIIVPSIVNVTLSILHSFQNA